MHGTRHGGRSECWARVHRPELWELFRAAFETASLVFVAKAQKIEMDKLEKAKKERTKVSNGKCSLLEEDRCWECVGPAG